MAQIKDLLPDPPVMFIVKPEDLVSQAVSVMSQENVGIVMVLDGNRLVGVFSERDLIRRVLGKGLNPKDTKMEAVMTRRVVFAREQDDPEMCLQKMEREGCRHLPVISGDQAVGMLSIRDLMRNILQKREGDLKMLEKYVTSP